MNINADEIIVAQNLVKKYDGNHVIDDVSLFVKNNSITGVIGKDKSGKTTLLKLLAGFLPKSHGKIQVFGENPKDNINVLSKIIYIDSAVRYDKWLRLFDIMKNYKTMYPAFDFETTEKMLEHYELDVKTKYSDIPSEIVNIINFIFAISSRAPITIFDRPFTGMSTTVKRWIYDTILKEHNKNQNTIIISDNSFADIGDIISQVIIINNGKLLFNQSMINFKKSACTLIGDNAEVNSFIKGKKVIWKKQLQKNISVVVHEIFDETSIKMAKSAGLRISGVRPDNLFEYLMAVSN